MEIDTTHCLRVLKETEKKRRGGASMGIGTISCVLDRTNIRAILGTIGM